MPTMVPMSGAWLIDPRAGRMIQSRIAERARVAESESDKVPRMWTAANRDVSKMPKAVAVLPLTGIMEPRASDYTYYFGGTSTELFGQAFDRAIADPSVKAVVIDIFSPGGMVYGTPELARKVYNARGTKPIVSIANPVAASAALWVGTAADRFYVTPSGDAGSHGAYTMHIDESKAWDEAGIKFTFISAGKYKTEGNPYEPASAEFIESEQKTVNEIMSAFTSDLAKHRGKTTGYVLENFGQGRLLSAKQSVEVGMTDGIATFEQVVARLLTGHIRTGSAAANDDWSSPVDENLPTEQKRFGNVADLIRRKSIARRQNNY